MSELAPVAGLAAAYGAGLVRWREHAPRALPSTWRVSSFVAGLLTLVVALGPLAGASLRGLTPHMTQHLLLIGVAAPLLVVGEPTAVMVWVLPPDARARVAGLGRRLLRRSAGPGWALWLGLSALAFVGVTWAWHFPVAHDAALASPWWHLLEHASMLAAAAWFWWCIVAARRRERFGYGVLAVFATTVALSTLGVALVLSADAWYAYDTAAPVVDQQIGGVIMWTFGGVCALVGALALFIAWLGPDET